MCEYTELTEGIHLLTFINVTVCEEAPCLCESIWISVDQDGI